MRTVNRTAHQRGATRVIIFNKPFGVLSQFSQGTAGGSALTLSDFIQVPDVYPAGRLDKDSEGLLVLTNDGRLQSRIADPRFKQPKTYLVQVEGEPGEPSLDLLRQGIRLDDGMTQPASVERIDPPEIWPRDPPIRFRKTVPDCWVRMTIREGRNRQVRRMTAAIGHPTLRLVRWSVGDWAVAGLAPGTWAEVAPPGSTRG